MLKAAVGRCLQFIESFVPWPWFCNCLAPEGPTPLYLGQKPHVAPSACLVPPLKSALPPCPETTGHKLGWGKLLFGCMQQG